MLGCHGTTASLGGTRIRHGGVVAWPTRGRRGAGVGRRPWNRRPWNRRRVSGALSSDAVGARPSDRPPRLSTPPRRGAARHVAGLVGHFHSLPAFSGLQTLDPGCTVTTQGHEPSAQCPVFGPRHVKASWVLIGIFIIVASFLAGFERQAAHTLELVGGCGRGQKGTLFSSLYPRFSLKEWCQDAVEVALAPKGRGGGSAPCL